MTTASVKAPLAGIVVIEHARGMAAAYAGRVLALMGATVIKIEPRGGDPLRNDGMALAPDCNVPPLFAYVNFGKSNVTLDLESETGRTLFHELLDRATVFLDDTAPSTRESTGISPDELRDSRPQLIYLSVLPFGALGEHRDYIGYELNMFHAGGEGYLMPNGLALERFPDRPPVKIYGHFADFNGGTSAVCALYAALLVHDDIGGQFVDVSVQDANVAVSCFAIQQLGEGTLENRHERSFKYGGVLECADGYVQVLTLEQHQWEGLVTLMGDPGWALEPALRDPLERGRRGRYINEHLRAWARQQHVEDVVRAGQKLGVPLAKYAEPAEIMNSEQTKVRDMFARVPVEGHGHVPVLAAPFQFTRPESLAFCATEPGRDNHDIFCGMLGHTQADVERWHLEGAL